jgi:hypothetical protein
MYVYFVLGWLDFPGSCIQHSLTPAFHPQSNGMVKRVHQHLKDGLCARETGSSWRPHLPRVLLGLRAAPKEKSGLSLAELVYGAHGVARPATGGWEK